MCVVVVGIGSYVSLYYLHSLMLVGEEFIILIKSLHTKWVLDFLGLIADIYSDIHYKNFVCFTVLF